MGLWNNLHQVCSKSKGWKAKADLSSGLDNQLNGYDSQTPTKDRVLQWWV